MGHSEHNRDEDTRSRLVETARTLVLRGDGKFSISTLCREAGVDRDDFRNHFAGKAALMAAVMQSQSAAPQSSEMPAMREMAEAAPPAAQPVSEPTPKAEQNFEPSVSTPDAWLERRLRVFERALNALEAKAEASAREQARVIAQLEERLNGVPAQGPELVPAPMAMAATVPQQPKIEAAPQPAPNTARPQVHRVELAGVKQEQVPPADEMHKTALPGLAGLAPAPALVTSKEEMADMLQSVREKVRAVAAEPPAPPPRSGVRARWLAIGALSLVALFLFIGLSLGKNMLGGSASAQENFRRSDGVSYRHVASGTLARTTALADAGNTRAQARLALAYLRGQGSAEDANAALLWSLSAARSGNAVAQYILGALYQQGDHVKADPAVAFTWFSRAAEKGNLKAMHNLAIAYAQGLGTRADEARAAQWFTRAAERGYVDSAFDLAVLYERGNGVTQDLKQALKWYGIAAQAGDSPSRTRAAFLRGQMQAGDIKLAENAARDFSPLPALGEANSL